MTKDEALLMAIEALEKTKFPIGDKRNEAIQACKEALEQPAQEPYNFYGYCYGGIMLLKEKNHAN